MFIFFGLPYGICCGCLAGQHERLRLSTLTGGNRVHCPFRSNGDILVRYQGFAVLFVTVTMLYEQPIVAAPLRALSIKPHSDKNPATLNLAAGEGKLQLAVLSAR